LDLCIFGFYAVDFRIAAFYVAYFCAVDTCVADYYAVAFCVVGFYAFGFNSFLILFLSIEIVFSVGNGLKSLLMYYFFLK